MKYTIDITPFVCEAFMDNKRVWPLVDKQYNTNRTLYHKLYKESSWYNHYYLTSQSLKKEIIGRKIIGILLEGDSQVIDRLIFSGWPVIYNHVRKQPIYNAKNLYKEMSSVHKNLDKITDDQFNSWGYIGMVVAEIYGIELDTQDTMLATIFEVSQNRLDWINSSARCLLENTSVSSLAVGRNLKKEIYRTHNIAKPLHTYQRSASTTLLYDTLALIFDSEGLSFAIIEDINITEKEIDLIASCYQAELDIAPEKYLFISYLTKLLLRAYQEVKNDFLKNDNDNIYLEIDTIQEEAQDAYSEIERLKGIMRQQDQEINNLRKQLKLTHNEAVSEYKDINKSQEREIENLKTQLLNLQNQIQEHEASLFISAGATLEVDVSQYQGIIVGGRNTWHNKIKSYLPDTWRYIHPDDNIDLSSINPDIIFFATDYLSHAVYYSVIGEARRKQIPVGYIHHINPEEVLKEIKNILTHIKKETR